MRNAKMEVQKLNHKILSAFGMCLGNDASQLKRISSWAVNVVNVSYIVVFAAMPSIANMYVNADNLQNCLLAAYQAVAFSCCACLYLTFAKKKTVVHSVFVDCSRIVSERKRWSNDFRYERTERKCHRGVFVFLVPLSIIFVGNCVVASSHSIISDVLKGRLEPFKWYRPYRMT